MSINYYAYIQSNEWRQRANEAKQRAGYRCQVCNRPSTEVVLNAHHRTYDRLGNEHPEDITVLCRDCHKLYEENKKLVKTHLRNPLVTHMPTSASADVSSQDQFLLVETKNVDSYSLLDRIKQSMVLKRIGQVLATILFITIFLAQCAKNDMFVQNPETGEYESLLTASLSDTRRWLFDNFFASEQWIEATAAEGNVRFMLPSTFSIVENTSDRTYYKSSEYDLTLECVEGMPSFANENISAQKAGKLLIDMFPIAAHATLQYAEYRTVEGIPIFQAEVTIKPLDQKPFRALVLNRDFDYARASCYLNYGRSGSKSITTEEQQTAYRILSSITWNVPHLTDTQTVTPMAAPSTAQGRIDSYFRKTTINLARLERDVLRIEAERNDKGAVYLIGTSIFLTYWNLENLQAPSKSDTEQVGIAEDYTKAHTSLLDVLQPCEVIGTHAMNDEPGETMINAILQAWDDCKERVQFLKEKYPDFFICPAGEPCR